MQLSTRTLESASDLQAHIDGTDDLKLAAAVAAYLRTVNEDLGLALPEIKLPDNDEEPEGPTLKEILFFTGRNYWLSNFLESPLQAKVLGSVRDFQSVEQLFQAAKILFLSVSPEVKETLLDQFLNSKTPGDVKRLGRRLSGLDVESWDTCKDRVMTLSVEAKFLQNVKLRKMLLNLEGYHLEEGNNHGDRYWGKVKGKGKNRLGEILMDFRDRLSSAIAEGTVKDHFVKIPDFDAILGAHK